MGTVGSLVLAVCVWIELRTVAGIVDQLLRGSRRCDRSGKQGCRPQGRVYAGPVTGLVFNGWFERLMPSMRGKVHGADGAMRDIAGLPRIPQLHGRLFATRILVVLRSSTYRFLSARDPSAWPARRTPTGLDRRRKGLFVHDLSLV